MRRVLVLGLAALSFAVALPAAAGGWWSPTTPYGNGGGYGLGNPYQPTPPRGPDVLYRGYTRPDGQYVEPHYQTRPDGNPFNNYSNLGNVNPYTGRVGTKSPLAR